jgi:hypothetical protein
MSYPECGHCEVRFQCFSERDGHKSEVTTKGTGKCLVGWKEVILEEIPFVDVKPYSHNIISIALQAINKGWGNKEANRVIREFGLKSLGWHNSYGVVHMKTEPRGEKLANVKA